MSLLLLLACGEPAPPPPPSTPVAPRVAPQPAAPVARERSPSRVDASGLWGEVVLPVEDGEVISGGDMVILQWPATARSHHDAFANALVFHGFVLKDDLSTPEQTVQLYARGAREVMLSVSDDTVTLQDFGGDAVP